MEKQTGKDRRMTGNKKKIVCGALLCVMALGMTACGNEIPDLTEAESQRVGEYAAVTLLKYDANNRSRLVDPEIVIAKLEKELGVPLFDRQGRNIELNHAGKHLLEHVDFIF